MNRVRDSEGRRRQDATSASARRGRTKHAYLLPRHIGEIDRLDLQHYAFRAALGVLHQAPVERPALVLDAGAGTGQWGWDLSEEFPRALVVGVDLVAGKRGWPARYQPVRADLLHRLPFRDAVFDFVHQRLLFLGIPVRDWPAVAQDLVRVTKPGGWVELIESRTDLQGAGPAIEQLYQVSLKAAELRDLDTSSSVFHSLAEYLRRAGLREVHRLEVRLPIGEWGGEVGSLMATNFRTAFTRLLEARVGFGPAERAELLTRVQEEYEERHVTVTWGIAYGQRPM